MNLNPNFPNWITQIFYFALFTFLQYHHTQQNFQQTVIYCFLFSEYYTWEFKCSLWVQYLSLGTNWLLLTQYTCHTINVSTKISTWDPDPTSISSTTILELSTIDKSSIYAMFRSVPKVFSIYNTGDISLEIYDTEDTWSSFHVTISHMMCSLHILDMLYDLSHYNLTIFHMRGSHWQHKITFHTIGKIHS